MTSYPTNQRPRGRGQRLGGAVLAGAATGQWEVKQHHVGGAEGPGPAPAQRGAVRAREREAGPGAPPRGPSPPPPPGESRPPRPPPSVAGAGGAAGGVRHPPQRETTRAGPGRRGAWGWRGSCPAPRPLPSPCRQQGPRGGGGRQEAAACALVTPGDTPLRPRHGGAGRGACARRTPSPTHGFWGPPGSIQMQRDSPRAAEAGGGPGGDGCAGRQMDPRGHGTSPVPPRPKVPPRPHKKQDGRWHAARLPADPRLGAGRQQQLRPPGKFTMQVPPAPLGTRRTTSAMPEPLQMQILLPERAAGPTATTEDRFKYPGLPRAVEK